MKDPLANLGNVAKLMDVYNKGRAANAIPEPPATPPTDNNALDRCCRAYELAWQTAKDRGAGRNAVKAEAELAFRRAMPILAGHESIRDFIACIAHAVLIDAISGPTAARLLYAAQVAGSSAKAAASQKNPYKIPPGFMLQMLPTSQNSCVNPMPSALHDYIMPSAFDPYANK